MRWTSRRSGTPTRANKYESFADVARAVDPVFAQHGLSYRFSVAQKANRSPSPASSATPTATASAPSLKARPTQARPACAMVQALGSALTYLQRYCCAPRSALRLAIDDDGRAQAGHRPGSAPIRPGSCRSSSRKRAAAKPRCSSSSASESVRHERRPVHAGQEVLDLARVEQRREACPHGKP